MIPRKCRGCGYLDYDDGQGDVCTLDKGEPCPYDERDVD